MSGAAWADGKWESVSPDDPRGQPSAAYCGLVCYVSTDPCLAVVTADGSAVPPDQWPGIARLIAAAPDLVEALADLLVYHDVPPDAQDPIVRPLLRAGFAAIAKARGQ